MSLVQFKRRTRPGRCNPQSRGPLGEASSWRVGLPPQSRRSYGAWTSTTSWARSPTGRSRRGRSSASPSSTWRRTARPSSVNAGPTSRHLPLSLWYPATPTKRVAAVRCRSSLPINPNDCPFRSPSTKRWWRILRSHHSTRKRTTSRFRIGETFGRGSDAVASHRVEHPLLLLLREGDYPLKRADRREQVRDHSAHPLLPTLHPPPLLQSHSTTILSSPAAGFGYFMSISSNVRTSTSETTQLRNHLRSAGTTYHGACFCEQRRSTSSYASW